MIFRNLRLVLPRVRNASYPGRYFSSQVNVGNVHDESYKEEAAAFYEKIQNLQKNVLKPLNTKLLGPLERDADNLTPLPMVLIIGNHSSGKSTFINYVSGRAIQNTGVAPTDDAFTIIAPGKEDADQDGPSLIGDQGMGFTGLRLFGNNLINHVSLKIRKDLGVDNVMLIDSPGMIDAPVTSEEDFVARGKDRGYDFPAVVKWFAERADVILLFQDPAKPGTTGETLSVMTTALAGQDFKTHIILNKADQFTTVHDFARAYGALCWNLSKVIPRKDLPRIYTMAVPTDKDTNADNENRNSPEFDSKSGMLLEAKADLDRTRSEIVAEIMKAPMRRVDNLATRLYDSARLLHMHAQLINSVRASYNSEFYKVAGSLTMLAVTGGLFSASLFTIGSVPLGASIAGVTALGLTAASWWANRHLAERSLWYIEGPGLEVAFRSLHAAQIAEKDEFTTQIFERVRPQTVAALQTKGIRGCPGASRSELQALENLIEKEVPALRRSASKAASLISSPMHQTPKGFAAAVNSAVHSFLFKVGMADSNGKKAE